MTKLITIALLSFFIKANAQVNLSIGDVYDYAPGDVFQYYQTDYSGPTYMTDTVMAKNPVGNSVTYQINRYSYQLQSCQSCSPTIARSTYSVSYSNLSSNFTYTNASSCCTASVSCYHDTLKASGYCNLPTYESAWSGPMDPSNLSICMKYDVKFTKGLGISYEHNRSSNTPYDQTKQMIY
jgi:hypothetical protein